MAGTWKVERARASAALVVTPFEKLARTVQVDLVAEGKALVQFIEPDAARSEVRFAG